MTRVRRPDIEPKVLTRRSAPAQRALLKRYLDGAISGEMAIMYWLKAFPDVHNLRQQLRAAEAECANGEHGGAVDPLLRALTALLDQNNEGCEQIARMVRSNVDNDRPAGSVSEGIDFCRNLFDWSVGQSAESSVALYSLGNVRILDAATAEIVAMLKQWQVVRPDRDILEIGCGTGRFEDALSAQAKTVTGIDVSSRMIAAARDRCSGLANVTLLESSGHDLALFDDDSFDAVLAVDSFPYLYQSGMALVAAHFKEAWRVLRRDGDFVILEFSYRGDVDRDRIDLQQLASATGFNVRILGTQPFSIWDGVAFVLKSTKI
jgi:SAM-dependent methyltransferase